MTIKHEIELIPFVAHNLTLHRLLPPKAWRKIKNDILEEEGKKCWICGKEGIKLEAHEFWDFNQGIQKLKEIHHICYLCHGAKHLGYWYKRRDSKKKVAFAFAKKLEKHFCEVNNCSKKDLIEHYREIKRKRYDLEGNKVIIDFGRYSRLIPKLKRDATKYLTEIKGINDEVGNFIKSLPVVEVDKEMYKYNCLDCGRPIRHKGRCFSCNVKRKWVREKLKENG